MSNYLQLLKAECVKVFGDVKNYWLNYIFGNINVFFMFFGLFFAFDKNNNTDLEILMFLIGLMYWYFGVHSVDLISILIEEEIEQGTLEQLLMSRTHLIISLFFRVVAQILFDAFKGFFVFMVCVLAFKINFLMFFRWTLWLSGIIFFIGLFAMYGIGYIVAGVTLIYKRASAIASLSSNLILFFSGAIISVKMFPMGIQMIIKLFPIYWSTQIIESLLNENWSSIFYMLAILLVELIVWIVGGMICLNKCLEIVYERGTTGSY